MRSRQISAYTISEASCLRSLIFSQHHNKLKQNIYNWCGVAWTVYYGASARWNPRKVSRNSSQEAVLSSLQSWQCIAVVTLHAVIAPYLLEIGGCGIYNKIWHVLPMQEITSIKKAALVWSRYGMPTLLEVAYRQSIWNRVASAPFNVNSKTSRHVADKVIIHGSIEESLWWEYVSANSSVWLCH